MRRAFAAAAVLTMLAFAGGASARSFTIVPTGPAAFPSSETPKPILEKTATILGW